MSVGRRPSSSNGKWGFIDKAGREVVPARYDDTGDFSEGLAPVYVGAHPHGKWGFIDKTGREVAPCLYEGYDPPHFVEGLAAVCLNDKWGFIDKTGREVVPCKYTAFPNIIPSFSDGLAAVCVGDAQNGVKWGFVDKTGQEVIPCKYDEAADFSEGLALVYLDGKYGFIDAAGKDVLPCAYEGVCSFSDGLAAVKQNGKWGFIDKTGREVIPFRYDDAWDFSDGLAAVEQNGKWGFIDKTGQESVPCEYDEVRNFSDGLAVVGRVTGEMDESGMPVCKWGLIAAPQVGKLGDREELTWVVAGDRTIVSITAGADALSPRDMVLAACWDASGRFVGATLLQADRLEGRLPEGFSYGKLLWLSADRAPRCQYAQTGAVD